jgi:hypothetical protein
MATGIIWQFAKNMMSMYASKMKPKLRKRFASFFLGIVGTGLPHSWPQPYKTKAEDHSHDHAQVRGQEIIRSLAISGFRLRLSRAGSFGADAFLVRNTWLRRHFPRIYIFVHGG